MNIPIDNIYYLLSYAWDKLEEKNRVDVSTDGIISQVDLLGKILVNASRILIKRGIESNYVEEVAEIPGIKGKLLVGQSIKSNVIFNYRSFCQYDSYSPNVLINQILISTVVRLIYVDNLDNSIRDELKKILWQFPEIDIIELNPGIFNRIRLNRNNRFYGFILNVCELIVNYCLPSEKKGRYKMEDFTKDDIKMYRLFENFVFNFYRIELSGIYKVRREQIKWSFDVLNPDHLNYIPNMLTDITIESEESKIIIDTKYYQETMSQRYEARKIKSANLYQLFSYIINQRDGSQRNDNTRGILLYPTIDEDYDLDYRYESHELCICTVNLNAPWVDIHKILFQIISE